MNGASVMFAIIYAAFGFAVLAASVRSTNPSIGRPIVAVYSTIVVASSVLIGALLGDVL